MMNTKTLFAAACLLGASISVQAVPVAQLFGDDGSVLMSSTGVTLTGAVDQSYRLTAINAGAVDLPMSVTSASWLSSNTAESRWISHNGNSSVADITLAATTTLDLSSVDLSGNDFLLRGFWISDNQGLDIRVNGVSTGQANELDHTAAPSALAGNYFEISSANSALISGLNTVEFVWGNGQAGGVPGSIYSPVSLRVELDSYEVQPVPVPGAIYLFVSSLFALGIRRLKA